MDKFSEVGPTDPNPSKQEQKEQKMQRDRNKAQAHAWVFSVLVLGRIRGHAEFLKISCVFIYKSTRSDSGRHQMKDEEAIDSTEVKPRGLDLPSAVWLAWKGKVSGFPIRKRVSKNGKVVT